MTMVSDQRNSPVAIGEMPSPKGVVCLQDVLDRSAAKELGGLLAPLTMEYRWHAEENHQRAFRWCCAYLAARAHYCVENPGGAAFLVQAVLDIYHYDRAQRAHDMNKAITQLPVRRCDIPIRIERKNAGGQLELWDLGRRSLTWSADTPYEAVDAVASVLAQTPPDELWIAEYKRRSAIYDPIIFARFGSWEVEIARWGEEEHL